MTEKQIWGGEGWREGWRIHRDKSGRDGASSRTETWTRGEDRKGERKRVPTEAYFWLSKQSPYDFCFVKPNFIRSSGVSFAEQSIPGKTLEHGKKKKRGWEGEADKTENICLQVGWHRQASLKQ